MDDVTSRPLPITRRGYRLSGRLDRDGKHSNAQYVQNVFSLHVVTQRVTLPWVESSPAEARVPSTCASEGVLGRPKSGRLAIADIQFNNPFICGGCEGDRIGRG